ncbi:MAG: hypothetical protein J0H47_09220 [Gammaproteobacteria bacterium]|nr:hypothetical protein [Gammaproteobacteria bacterium]
MLGIEQHSSTNRAQAELDEKEDATSSRLTLDDELWQMAFQYLPAYAVLGQNSVKHVSKSWQHSMQAESVQRALKEKLNIAEIIANCRRDKTEALPTLRCKNIFNNLSFAQILEIASLCPEIAEQIIDKLRDQLKGEDLAIIGQHSPEIINNILDDAALFNKMTPYDIGDLCKHHLVIARQLFNATTFRAQWGLSGLAALSAYHPELAHKIIDDISLHRKLTSFDLASLGQHDRVIALKIFNTPALRKTLGTVGLFSLNQSHPGLTDMNIDPLGMFSVVPDNNINDINMAEIIIGNLVDAGLLDELSNADLTRLGSSYPLIADRVLNTPDLCSKLMPHVQACFKRLSFIANEIQEIAEQNRDLKQNTCKLK